MENLRGEFGNTPAVQQAREAALRMQYKNNLKQPGLASHNDESAYTVFPPSTIQVQGFYEGTLGEYYAWGTLASGGSHGSSEQFQQWLPIFL